ncbi:hypothetical protein [Amphritea sp. HPY]|uniref:hypothetical protein n=1 Tax=Amphritea sp. HPY TaxID=3421652 RepID=UPI003D7D1F69
MDNCWANILNDCDGGISREHIVSKSLFIGTKINVQGFSWCKDEPKLIGLANLTKKCLCKEHNSLLSPLDQAGSHAFDVLRKQAKLIDDRAKEPNKKFKKVTFSINATALERWLLKTLINFSYGGEYYIGHDSDHPGRASDHLVKAAYGLESFSENNGMRVAYKEGGTINSHDAVQFAPVIKDNKFIYGAKFSFRGILLFMDISPDGMNVPFEDIPGTQDEWKNVFLSRKFKQIQAKHGNKISHVVNFNWA